MIETRCEKKFIIDYLQVEEIVDYIKKHPALFRETYEARTIHTLYLDTLNHESFLDNMEGSPNKVKFRFRWYNQDMSKVNFEIKKKLGDVYTKTTYKVSEYNLRNPLKSKIVFGSQNNISSFLPFLTPIATINYERRYFESSDHKLRLTLDHKIKARHLLSKYANQDNLFNMPRGAIIVEVKYKPEDEPSYHQFTKHFAYRRGKFSKFVEAVKSI